MKYGKVKNGKVVSTQSGSKPSDGDWRQIIVEKKPTDYPSSFYIPTISPYKHIVDKDTIREQYGFVLQSVDEVKRLIREIHRQERKVEESLPLLFMGVEVDISKEKTKSRIKGLKGTGSQIEFYVKQETWLTLTSVDVTTLQETLEDKEQQAFTNNKRKNDELNELETLDELKVYFK